MFAQCKIMDGVCVCVCVCGTYSLCVCLFGLKGYKVESDP